MILFLFALLLAFPVSSSAQGGQQAVPFIMNLDYARFRNDAKSGYLEIYYQFYISQLTFVREGSRWRGAIVVKTDIINEQTQEKTVRDHMVLPLVFEDTVSFARMNSVIRQAGHLLPFGKYLLDVVAYDSVKPSMRDKLTLSLDINRILGAPAISDLQLCSSIKPSENKANPFYKNAHEVVANPTLVFGALYPVIYVYAELYDLDPARTYGVEYEVLNDAGAVVKKSSRNRQYRASNTVEVGTINAVALPSGRYTLRLSLKDPQTGIRTRVEKRFYVNNPTVAMDTPGVVSPLVADAIAALSSGEIDREFEQIKYLATEAELSIINQLRDTEGKRKFLQDFWTRREEGSDGRPPVRRSDFLRSVSLSNERFSYLGKEGWRTDRGRVFIQYGNPDEIERRPSEGEARPYEIWYYYRIENGVQFVFVDRSGFGDYQLVHSTKRGELRDEGWSRFLR